MSLFKRKPVEKTPSYAERQYSRLKVESEKQAVAAKCFDTPKVVKE